MVQNIDLKKSFPHSASYLVYLTAPVLFVGVLLSATLALYDFTLADTAVYTDSVFFRTGITVSSMCILLIGGLRLLYGILFLKRYQYEVRNGNLIVSKGIFLRKQGSYPLRRITDVYIRNDWRTLLFGLYGLEALTPSRESHEFCRIEGLSRSNATALKECLLTLIERSEEERKVRVEPAKSHHQHARQSMVARRHPRHAEAQYATR